MQFNIFQLRTYMSVYASGHCGSKPQGTANLAVKCAVPGIHLNDIVASLLGNDVS